jgi:hypothetical protein
VITQFEKGYGIPVLTEIGGAIEQAAIQKHNNELEAQTAAIEEYIINSGGSMAFCPIPPRIKSPAQRSLRPTHRRITPICRIGCCSS